MFGIVLRKTAHQGSFFILQAILLIIVSYSNTLYSPPVLDDFPTFIHEIKLQVDSLSADELSALSTTEFGWKRWIPLLTLALDFRLGEGAIVNFHLTNILIHTLCMFAVWFLSFQLFKIAEANSTFPYCSEGVHSSIHPICWAAWIAGLWALNPVQTSAVTYIVQRMAMIQAFFYITSIACYIKGRRIHIVNPCSPLKYVQYTICVLAAVCAFFSKENCATLPAMILFTEIWFFQPDLLFILWNSFRRCKWPVYGIVIAGFVAALMIGAKIFSQVIAAYDIRHFTLLERLLTESRVVLWYLSLLVWPVPSRISLEYDVNISTSLWQPPTTVLSILVIAFLIWSIFRLRKSQPVFSYALLWFFVNLFVESSFVPLELLFVHRLYLPSVGFYICLTVGIIIISRYFALRSLAERDRAILCWCIYAILISCLSLMTFSRNQVWQTRSSIFGDSMTKAPDNPRAHVNYASSLLSEGRCEEALNQAEIALKLGRRRFEEYSVAANIIVTALMHQGKMDAAIQRGQDLLANHPPNIKMNAFPALHLNIAKAHQELGQLAEAYSTAVAGMDLTLRMKRSLYESTKRSAEKQLAEILSEADRRCVDLTGTGKSEAANLQTKVRIAFIYLELGADTDAKRLLWQAVSENPLDNHARDALTDLLKKEELDQTQKANWNFTGKYTRNPFSAFNMSMLIAYTICEKNKSGLLRGIGEHCIDYALKTRPDSADAHLLKGWYYYGKDQVEKAVAEARRALELEPNSSRNWLGLGFFLAKANENFEAAAAFQTMLDLYPGYSKRTAVQQMISTLRAEASSQ